MRRADREVTDINRIFDIVSRCNVANVAMVENGKPYVVALNFGYERKGETLILYFHSAYEGRKINALRQNPFIYFAMNCANGLVKGSEENPCAYSWRYDSVMGSGQVEFIEDSEEKSKALNLMIRHLDKENKAFVFPEAKLKRTCVFRVCSTDFTGKRRG